MLSGGGNGGHIQLRSGFSNSSGGLASERSSTKRLYSTNLVLSNLRDSTKKWASNHDFSAPTIKSTMETYKVHIGMELQTKMNTHGNMANSH